MQGGLENQTLSEGYKKLLITDADAGLNGDMSSVTTSGAGDAVIVSPLYMGKNVNDQQEMKLISTGTSHRFFSLQANKGTNHVNDATGADTMLAAYASSTPGSLNNSIFDMKCLLAVDGDDSLTATQAGDNMGKGQIVFGLTGGSTPSLDAQSLTYGPSIFYKSPGDVHFRQHGNNPSSHWVMDRLKITNDTRSTTIPVFDATDVDVSAFKSISAAGIIDANLGLVSTGGTVGLHSSADIYIEGESSFNILDTPMINIEARSDASAAQIHINAVSKDSDVSPTSDMHPTISIGTFATSTADKNRSMAWDGSAWTAGEPNLTLKGTETITVGHNTAETITGDYQKLYLNSKYIYTDAASIPIYSGWDASVDLSVAGKPNNTAPYGTRGFGLYFGYVSGTNDVETGVEGTMRYYDKQATKAFKVDAVNHADGRVTRYSPRASNPPEPVLDNSHIYVKGNKLVVAYTNGTDTYYNVMNMTTGAWTSSTTEP